MTCKEIADIIADQRKELINIYLDSVDDLLRQAKEAVADGYYLYAMQRIDTANTYVDKIRDLVSKAEKEKPCGIAVPQGE